MKAAYCTILLLQIGGILSFRADTMAQKNLQKLCHKNGGQKAVTAFEQGVAKMQSCVQPIARDWAIQISKNGKMDSAFALVCEQIGELKNCLKQFTDTLKSCFKPDQYETIEFLYKLSASMMQFMCDNIEEIEKAMKSPDIGCVLNKQNELKRCVARFSTARNASIQHHEVDSMEALSVTKVKFDAKGCSELQGVQQCTVSVLAECEDKTFSNLLDTMYKYANNDIPCENLPKSGASISCSVVSILMLIPPVITVYF